MIIQAFSNAMM